MMGENDAIEIIADAERHGISVFLDGGWGGDALLGRQTREHNDIDLFIEKGKGEEFIALLKEKGFQEIRKDYTTPAHTVWQDAGERVVDLHLYESGENGSLLFEGNRLRITRKTRPRGLRLALSPFCTIFGIY